MFITNFCSSCEDIMGHYGIFEADSRTLIEADVEFIRDNKRRDRSPSISERV